MCIRNKELCIENDKLCSKSTSGTTGLNPKANIWDVPMELRCAKNENLTEWGDPIWSYPVYYNRWLPYDPPRPWKDTDGMWYSSFSSDGCNGTNQWGPTPADNLNKAPCKPGGQLELLVADGDVKSTNWRLLPPLFTTNVTKSGALAKTGAIQGEFVTSGYFGGLPGDPDGGKTRVVTQNNGGSTYWVGKQEAGGQFSAYWDKLGAVGHYVRSSKPNAVSRRTSDHRVLPFTRSQDYGAMTMARTLGSDHNQVAKNGRRVLVGWVQDDPRDKNVAASQSLSRDLSLSAEYELLQQFVPEYKILRQPATFEQTPVRAQGGISLVTAHSAGSLQIEIVATFTFTAMPKAPFGVTTLGGAAEIMVDCANTTIMNMGEAPGGCMVAANLQYNGFKAVAGRPGPVHLIGGPPGHKTVTMHIIVDHEIMESIINNRTAVVSYHKNIPSAASTAVWAWAGIDNGVTGSIKSWHLDAANNAGPRP